MLLLHIIDEVQPREKTDKKYHSIVKAIKHYIFLSKKIHTMFSPRLNNFFYQLQKKKKERDKTFWLIKSALKLMKHHEIEKSIRQSNHLSPFYNTEDPPWLSWVLSST